MAAPASRTLTTLREVLLVLLWVVLLICLVASLVAARARTLAITTRDHSNSSRAVEAAVPLTRAKLPLISPRVQQDLLPQGLLRDRSPTERPRLTTNSITSNTVLISNSRVRVLRTVHTNSRARTPLTVRISSNPALTHSSLVPTHLMAHTSNSQEPTRNMELVNNTPDRTNRTDPTRNSQARTLPMDLTSSQARINSQVLTHHMAHRLARTSSMVHNSSLTASSSMVPTLSMVEVRMDPRTTRSLLHPQEVRLNSMDNMGSMGSRASRHNTSLLLLLHSRRTSSNMDKAIPITPRPLVVSMEVLLINMDKINRPTVHLQLPETSSTPLPLLEDTIPHTTEAKEASLLMAVVPPLFHTELTQVNMEAPTERPFEEIWKSTTFTAHHAVVP